MTSGRPSVLLTAKFPDGAAQLAERSLDLLRLDHIDDPAGGLADGAGIRALLTAPSVGASRALLEKLPDLELISVSGAGLDRIDGETVAGRGITVEGSGAYLAEEVADTALLLMMAAVRNLLHADRHVRSGAWSTGVLPLTRSSHGRRVGIVGFGSIGQAVARRLHTMGSEVRYCSRRPVAGRSEAHVPDLAELAHWAEILVLALPGGPSTEGIVDAEIIDALGPQGTLVNVARGSVVDEEALIVALQEGRLGQAGLDVFLNEPRPDARFLMMSNVVLTPHFGSASTDAREAAATAAVRRVIAHLNR